MVVCPDAFVLTPSKIYDPVLCTGQIADKHILLSRASSCHMPEYLLHPERTSMPTSDHHHHNLVESNMTRNYS